MTSTKFIKNRVKDLLTLIPELEVFYLYNSYSQSHFLKILPLEQFENNETYIQFEQDLTDTFFSHYPFELITFLSENDQFEMTQAKKLVNKYFIKHNTFDFNKIIESLLSSYDAQIPTSINFSAYSSLPKLKIEFEETMLNRKNRTFKNNLSVTSSSNNYNENDSEINPTNCEDYPFAA